MQLISTNGPIHTSTSILLDQPDISELHEITVILQIYAAGFDCVTTQSSSSRSRHVHLVVNFDAVVNHGQAGVTFFIAGLVEPRRTEGNIISLPLHRRSAHIY